MPVLQAPFGSGTSPVVAGELVILNRQEPKASPLAASGRVIVTSGDGVVSVLSAGDHLDVLANNDLGEPVAASPAFVDGVLYVRTASGLSAFRQP